MVEFKGWRGELKMETGNLVRAQVATRINQSFTAFFCLGLGAAHLRQIGKLSTNTICCKAATHAVAEV